MPTDRGLVYIFDMESGLADALSRRILDMNQYIVFRSWKMDMNAEQEIAAYGSHLRALIISGSGKSINGKINPIPNIPAPFLSAGVPILGICYGLQYLAHLLGTPIIRCWEEQDSEKRSTESAKKDKGEQGVKVFRRLENSILFRGLGDEFPIWMKHNWMLGDVPAGWTLTGRTEMCPVASIERGNIFGVQFHPEPTYSLAGRTIIHNFLSLACDLKTPYF